MPEAPARTRGGARSPRAAIVAVIVVLASLFIGVGPRPR